MVGGLTWLAPCGFQVYIWTRCYFSVVSPAELICIILVFNPKIFHAETCLLDVKKMEPIDGLNRINKVFVFQLCQFHLLLVLVLKIFLMKKGLISKLNNEKVKAFGEKDHLHGVLTQSFKGEFVLTHFFLWMQDRWRLLCSICSVSYGACIQV